MRVNLSAGTLKGESVSEDVTKKYLGGKGYSTYLLYQYLKECESKGICPTDINPLGPENVLIFSQARAQECQVFHHLEDIRSWPLDRR